MTWGRVAFAFAAAGCLACGNRVSPAPEQPEKKDAGAPAPDAALEVDGASLGLPDLASYRWRRRAGQPAFRLAWRAEERGDWAGVVAACQQALAADPGHLEASWLVAVGLAKLGKLDQVLAPLSRAAAGDFGKWGQASLELPGMGEFLATPVGEAWRRRVALDRARMVDAIARSVVVTAGGQLYAVEVDSRRWHRLTRGPGAVLGAIAVPAANRLAYVARTRHKAVRQLGVGVVDLAEIKTWLPLAIGSGPVAVTYSASAPLGVWVGTGGARAAQWRQLDDTYQLHPLPPRTPRPAGPWLEVTARGGVLLHALPPNVTADWDEQSLASAIRIGRSNRVVSVPSPGLIDGNTAAWSPDRVHIAFVAQLDDHCAAGAVNTAAFIADASTGATRELERAAGGIALQWLGDRALAIAGDHGVAVHSLDDAVPPIAIDGATGLLIPRERPRCAAPEPGDEPVDDAEPAEAAPGGPAGDAAPGDEPADAGVDAPR
jgi:hypothetical protein